MPARRRADPDDPRLLPAAGASRAASPSSAPASPAWSSSTCSRRFGAKVTLVVSRQQVLPQKDPEVAAVLEDDFLKRGVQLLKGARADRRSTRDGDGVVVRCDDGRVVRGTPRRAGDRLGAQQRRARPRRRRRRGRRRRLRRRSTTTARRNVAHIYAAGDVSGKLPLSSVAAMQGRKVAEHVMGLHTREPPPPRLRQGGVGDLHRAGDRRRRPGRGRGVRRRAARSASPRCRSRRRRRR